VEVPHSNFAEVARMVFVDVRSVVVLATCHTATTRMLSVLAYTTMTGRDMAATGEERWSAMLAIRAELAMRINICAMLRDSLFSRLREASRHREYCSWRIRCFSITNLEVKLDFGVSK
jgi:hypothetical protein